MKLPKPRFTVRWLMVAVAIVALILGGVIISERRRSMFTLEYRRHALAGYEAALKSMIVVSGLMTPGQPLPPLPELARKAGLDAEEEAVALLFGTPHHIDGCIGPA